MIGEADDGMVIFELYPSNDLPSEDNQVKSEHPQPQILYVDHELTIVVLQASIWDYLQLVGVDDPKWDWGEVTEVCDDRSTQLQLSDGVFGFNCDSAITDYQSDFCQVAAERGMTLEQG